MNFKNYVLKTSCRAIKTLSQRFKEEEISNQKLKESVIAERIKNEMYVQNYY